MTCLDPRHVATLTAVVDRIIPTDHDPGAREAGTIAYVLERARAEPALAARYRALADHLDELVLSSPTAGSFATLGVDEQDRLLNGIDPSESGLDSIVAYAMEGFYGDPRHGGNRDAVSWQMLGFPGPTAPRGYTSPLGWYDATTPIDPRDRP